MAYQGSGTFVRLYNWIADRDSGIKIRADRMDAEMDGMATGMSMALLKDGQQVATANQPMGTFKHSNVGAATARTHYLRAAEGQDSALQWGGTDTGAANAYVFALPINVATYVAGQMFGGIIGAAHTNTGVAVTVNFGGGTKTVKMPDGSIPPAGTLVAGTAYRFLNNGTDFLVINSSYAAYTQGHLYGLTLSNGGDATNDIDIAVGSARDSTNAANLVLGTIITKRLDAAWAVGTGNGGLDTGSIANTTYHIWLIKRIDTGVVDALFSASATAPTMPANYTLKRRIGSILRESAAIVAFSQVGDEFLRAPIGDVASTNPGTSAVLLTLSVPTGINTLVKFRWLAANSVTYASNLVLFTSPDEADRVPYAVPGDTSSGNLQAIGTLTVVQVGGESVVRTNTSAQVRSRFVASDATLSLYVATYGWIDTRGRLS